MRPYRQGACGDCFFTLHDHSLKLEEKPGGWCDKVNADFLNAAGYSAKTNWYMTTSTSTEGSTTTTTNHEHLSIEIWTIEVLAAEEVHQAKFAANFAAVMMGGSNPQMMMQMQQEMAGSAQELPGDAQVVPAQQVMEHRGGSADEILKAKGLLDAGAITQEESDVMKAEILL